MFKGRNLVIATKHSKEEVIAPLLENELGVHCFADTKFDTDVLGTFSGEIERKLDPLSAVREKCLRVMDLNNVDLGIANEGSFGPHPSIYFVPADDEIVLFIDKKNNIEIISREISTDTNFKAQYIKSEKELMDFANKALFPSHALILRNAKEEQVEIHKGVQNQEKLISLFHLMMEKYGQVYVETDMRAMYNPSRMNVIEKATQKLIDKIKDTCPQCSFPGFDISDVQRGLPCSLCGSPTNTVLAYLKKCKSCGYESRILFPDQKTNEDPMYCDVCNP